MLTEGAFQAGQEGIETGRCHGEQVLQLTVVIDRLVLYVKCYI